MNTFVTRGTCSRKINYEIENGIITKCEFVGGCLGNTQGVAKLVIGLTPEQVIDKLDGIICRSGTSCPDQLSKAMKEYLNKN
jgi:uncharacterized protein (TIGR03905 family)